MKYHPPLLPAVLVCCAARGAQPNTPPAPAVIPIDVGRQLFVDDYLIGETTLTRTYHTARLYDKNPILKSGTPVEMNQSAGGRLPVPCPLWLHEC